MNEMTKDERTITELTRRLVVNCVRNPLEIYHVGNAPFSETGDNSDIKVIDALGQEFTFDQISRISDPEMKALKKEIVDRAYTFLLNIEDAKFMEMMARLDASTARWDQPKVNEAMLERKYFRLLKEMDMAKPDRDQN